MVTGKGRGAFQAFRGRRRGTEPSSATVRSTFAPGHLVEALYVRDLLALPQRAVPRDLPALTPSVAQQSAAGVDEELVEQWNGCWEWLVDLSVVVDPEFTDEVTRRWPR